MPHGAQPARASVADLSEALARIAEDRDWTALEALCDRHILAAAGDLAGRLLFVLSQVPDEELRARPRLMLAWISAYHAMNQPEASELRPYLRHYAELGTRLAATMDIPGETSLATLVAVGTAAMIGLRMRGASAEAEELGERLTARAAQLGSLPGAEGEPRPGWLAMQRGLTRSLMGDFPAAVELYRKAYERATVEPETAATALNAAANLAMIFGHLGHAALAHQWLDRMRGFASPSERVRFLLTVGGTIAEGWDALDRYDEASLAACLEITGDGTRQLEVWPFVAALVFAHGLYLGDPATSLAQLGTLRLTHAPALVEQGTAARVIRRAHVELLTATGQATRALRLIKEADPQATWSALPAARLRLLNGEYELARAMASRTSWHETTSRRDARQLLLVKAIAALRMGDQDEARRSLALVRHVRTADEVLSLASLPPADRDEVIRLGELPLTDAAAERLARARPVFPERVELVELTTREQVVLTQLDAGLTITEVARTLVVSVNTVRTQVKSAYRKLGASSREGALMRAYELGVL
ncbi:LuxR C-terminal-related transcriptional regulator [Goodfellowiella coeruleoviolacea]|uniref:LuxR family transcriptional regulator, maltose regulon positive regulatory protein n=1 Tax=Goodfellowiella coeruleoviolacea TaxID=334858 RepID=A0AAE3GEU1_9PSEU|nr:LuxR C-terminal-related transcriptional regulator [Goodfellowiella coeruleoviolacea]MCP2164833.1 LuxR family transcriptional regulator, maltose regulon positive regulatory protein [Goodfellowiella coeruleoviolacea]